MFYIWPLSSKSLLDLVETHILAQLIYAFTMGAKYYALPLEFTEPEAYNVVNTSHEEVGAARDEAEHPTLEGVL